MSGVIVADTGARLCRLGLGDEERPRSVYPACVSRNSGGDPRFGDGVNQDTEEVLWMFGSGGYTADPKWDLWIEDWYTYAIMNELREDPSENNLLIVENIPGWTDAGKEKLNSILFNSEWQGVAYVPSSVLTLRTVVDNTGLVVDLAGSGIRVNAVVNGVVTAHAFSPQDWSALSGQKASKPHDAWMKDAANAATIISAVFEPASGKGVVALVSDVLAQEGSVASNTVITGGLALVSGLVDKLKGELAAKGCKVQVVAEPLLSAFSGAVDLAQEESLEYQTA